METLDTMMELNLYLHDQTRVAVTQLSTLSIAFWIATISGLEAGSGDAAIVVCRNSSRQLGIELSSS